MVAAAKQEGTLTLVFNPVLTSTVEQFSEWTAAFNKRYGLNVKVDYTGGQSMPQMAGRIVQEIQANRPASSDLWVGDPLSALSLLQADALAPGDWNWSSDLNGTKLVAQDGKLVEFEWQFPGISVNTDKLQGTDAPKSLADLLQPNLKGKVASTPYAAQFDVLATPEVWGEQKTTDYVTKLASQSGGLIGCGELDRVASGEFPAFALDCGAQFVEFVRSKGAHVAHVIPSDAAMYYPLYMGVPKNSAHPNVAKLFAAYVDSQEGQRLLYKLSFADHPGISGSQSAAAYQAALQAGVKFVDADVAFRQRNDPAKLQKLAGQFIGILTKK
ncbi:MAG: extracellular solute-binding protein [Chloroflexi bacterium]|nr:extracellular solute-binding protein [Chloroflexota bacterium]